MSVKTMVPAIWFLALKFCKYVEKHNAKLVLYLSPTQYTALQAACAALDAFRNLVTVTREEA